MVNALGEQWGHAPPLHARALSARHISPPFLIPPYLGRTPDCVGTLKPPPPCATRRFGAVCLPCSRLSSHTPVPTIHAHTGGRSSIKDPLVCREFFHRRQDAWQLLVAWLGIERLQGSGHYYWSAPHLDRAHRPLGPMYPPTH